MEIQNDRRKFVKGLGLFSAVLAGATVVHTQSANASVGSAVVPIDNSSTTSKTVIDPSVVALLDEQATNSLQLSQTYGEIAPPPPPCAIPSNGYLVAGGTYTIASNVLTVESGGNVCIGGNNKRFIPGTENSVDVKMVAGPDGELYLRVNDQWKRVLTT